MKINEYNFDILNKVSKLTLTDYNVIWSDAENIEGYIDVYEIFSMLEDLLI